MDTCGQSNRENQRNTLRTITAFAAMIAAIATAAPTTAQTVLFEFDNAPLHSPLPTDLTVGGIMAHFSATGQGYSIQRADTMGFTPVGFGGYCIYPSSVFPADLLVGFSQTLTGFSILYAPQELGCDDSATMRVTAYMDGALVGTNTTTADPPGTWPTGTLIFSSAQGFNSVVVHYDARPPTCQDYGPIFVADNMSVTPGACTPASVAQQPSPASTCRSGAATFSVRAAGTGPLAYQWQRETTPNSNTFVPLADGPTGTGSIISGATTATLTISGVSTADAVRYRCAIANGCGSVTSDVVRLAVCAADFNCSGAVNSQDIFDFLGSFFAGNADFNADGTTNSQDFFDFLAAFFGGCP